VTPPAPSPSFHRVSTQAAFAEGALEGVAPVESDGDAITLMGTGPGSWTGPWVEPGFDVEELIPSWNAETPPGSVVEVELEARTHVGYETGWYPLGRWAYDDAAFERTSVAGREDEFGRVDIDTFRAATRLAAYRLRLTLSAAGAGAPTVRLVGAVASAGGNPPPAESTPGDSAGVELAVPPYAQSIHAGEYPRYGGGGASWCSPTATAMVMAYWDAGPTPTDYAWVDPSIADPWVDHAARFTFDYGYAGTGNWPFNTAYAGHFGLEAFVTRLRSLREAELFVTAGIPLVASIAAAPGELDGFLLPQGTDGHLVVVVGFTPDGSPIVNDPAATSNATVRRVYDRSQLERAWLDGSGGVVYVIRGPGAQVPPSRGNW